MREKFFTTKNITVAATLTAIAFVLYAFAKFSLPFMFAPWLDLQFSDMPALIGGFMMGPVWGCIIIVIKCLLKMPMSGTSCVGELADIIVGIAFVLPATLIYQYHRTKKGAAVGLAVGTAVAVAASMLANAFILVPFFVRGMHINMDVLAGMLGKLYPSITKDNFYLFYLPLSVLPFNILRCLICALITFFVYKHLHKLINKMFAPRSHKKSEENIVTEPASVSADVNVSDSVASTVDETSDK